jgi:hypothetical protein
MFTQFWSENLNGRDHLGDDKPKWKDNIKMDLKHDVAWTQLSTHNGPLAGFCELGDEQL